MEGSLTVEKTASPLQGQCLNKNIVYQASVTSKNKTETYIGLISTDFKTRVANHKQTFKNNNLISSCKLAQHFHFLTLQTNVISVSMKSTK